jgi:hypothetical protein
MLIKMKEGTENTDKLPDWPQPAGIFKNGKFLNPLAFLQTVQDLYGVVTIRYSRGIPRV